MATGLSMASVNKIKELANAREYSLALDILKEQDLSKSLNPQFLRLCGEVYIENNDYKNARRVLNMAHRLAPESKRIYFSLMELYLRCGFFDLAKTYHDLYMHDADSDGEETKQLRYIYAKGTGESLEVLSEILGQIYVHHLDYDWSFETFLLAVKRGMKDDAKILAMDYSARFKNSDYASAIDAISKDNSIVDDYFLKYATHAYADNDPEEDDVRAQESKLIENDWLRIYPKDPEITIMFDEIIPDEEDKLSKRKLKKMFDKMEKEQLAESEELVEGMSDSVVSDDQVSNIESGDETSKDSGKEKKGLFGFFGKKKTSDESVIEESQPEEISETESIEESQPDEAIEVVESQVDDAIESGETEVALDSYKEETTEDVSNKLFEEENTDNVADLGDEETDDIINDEVEISVQESVDTNLKDDLFIKSKTDSDDSDFESVSINVDIDDSFDAEDDFDLEESEDDFVEEDFDEIPTEIIGDIHLSDENESEESSNVEDSVELDVTEAEEDTISLDDSEETLADSDEEDFDDFEADDNQEDIDEERLKNLDIVFGESYVDYKELKRRRREEKKANRRKAKAEKLGLVDEEMVGTENVDVSDAENAEENVEIDEPQNILDDYEPEVALDEVNEDAVEEKTEDLDFDYSLENDEENIDETTIEVDSLDNDFDAEEDFIAEDSDYAEEYNEESEHDEDTLETEENVSASNFKMSMTFQTFDLEPESDEDEEFEIENFSFVDDDGFGKMEEDFVDDALEDESETIDETAWEVATENTESEDLEEEIENTESDELEEEIENTESEEFEEEIEISENEELEEIADDVEFEETEGSEIGIEAAVEAVEQVEESIPTAVVLEEEYDAGDIEESIVIETDSIDEEFESETEIDDFEETEFEETVEESGEDFAEEQDEEIIEELVEEVAEDFAEEQDEEIIEELVEEVAEDFAEEQDEEIIEELVEEVAEDFAEEQDEEIVEELVEEDAEDFAEEQDEEQDEEIIEELVEEVAEDFAEEQDEEVIEGLAEELVENFTEEQNDEFLEEIVEETVDESIEEIEEPVSDEIAEEVVEDEIDETIEDISEEIIEEKTEDVVPVLSETNYSEDNVELSSISALGPKYKTLNKPNWEFPVFKSELFPEYHNEVKKTENSFDTVLEQGKGALSENLEKEAALAREAEELLKSLGIDLGTMSTPKEAVPKKININDSLYDEGPSREEIKAALVLDDAKKDILRKLKNRK